MKKMKFLDGSSYIVDEPYCRGCFMDQNKDKMPIYIEPIFDDGVVVVRQDAEWPIPGFYIISIHEHIGSIDKLDSITRNKIIELIYWVRRGLREELKIEHAQIYHEEKISNPHFHVWILPLWEQPMKKYNIQPKIYESNVKKYIDLFDFNENKELILKFNKIMKNYLEKHLLK